MLYLFPHKNYSGGFLALETKQRTDAHNTGSFLIRSALLYQFLELDICKWAFTWWGKKNDKNFSIWTSQALNVLRVNLAEMIKPPAVIKSLSHIDKPPNNQ